MKKGFTEKELKFLKENYLMLSSRKLAAHFGCSRTKINYHLKKEGLIIPVEVIEKFRVDALRQVTTASPQEDKFIKENYLTMPVKTIAGELGRIGDTFVRTRLKRLGLVIPKEIIEQRKRDSRFPPGSIPMNKGLKQTEYMTEEQINKTSRTRFKKGDLPVNTLYDGKITKRKDTLKTGEVIYYKWIRISIANWKMLHVFNWEKENGSVPEGYILVFKDGDRMNCEPSNLDLITLGENMLRNSIQNYPGEVRNLMVATGKLKSKLKLKITQKKNTYGNGN